MPKKFDGTRSKFYGFANQVRLFIRMQPHRFSTQISKVELVGTLLSGSVLSKLKSLNEKNSLILEEFETFVKKLLVAFGDIDKARMANKKIRDLCQGSCPASS